MLASPTPPTRPPDRATEAIYAYVKARILAGDYAPNTQVLQETIAAETGFSRTPIREAIIRLEQEGLVRVVPRHGIEILAMSPADNREIYEILACLEPKAVALLTARRPSRDDVARLLGACDAMEAALVDDDRLAWARADEDFHRSLAELCGNRRLHGLIMSFWDQSHRVRMFTLRLRPRPDESTREHRQVTEAILAGDVERAQRLYRLHRERAQEALLQIIEDYGLKRL